MSSFVLYRPEWEWHLGMYPIFIFFAFLALLWYHQLVLIGIWYLFHRYLFQLILIVGVLIPYLFVLLYLISVKYHPSLGILFSNWCLIDHVLFWFDPYWYLTSCVDVFWNQSYVDLIFSQSCVDLDFDIIWTTFFVSHFGVLSSWFTLCFRPNCISFGSCKSMHACLLVYILYVMLVFLVPIYRGYSTES